ncbi:MAG: acyloxyacyl hydrolase [Pararheinheimera sp.]|nr:acyloxyacyl hydrolase [Rheinheimera sp.]
MLFFIHLISKVKLRLLDTHYPEFRLNKQRFAGKDLGSHYQFEDRIGLIWQLQSKAQLALRYMHYSNAGLQKPNPGLDFIALSYAYRF